MWTTLEIRGEGACSGGSTAPGAGAIASGEVEVGVEGVRAGVVVVVGGRVAGLRLDVLVLVLVGLRLKVVFGFSRRGEVVAVPGLRVRVLVVVVGWRIGEVLESVMKTLAHLL